MTKKTIFAIITIIALGIGGIFYFTNLTNNESMANDQLPEGIVVEDLGNGEKVVRNVEEGEEIVISDQWSVPDSPLTDEKIIIEQLGMNNQPDTELQDGVYMQLFTFDNPKNQSIQTWATSQWGYKNSELKIVQINNIDVFRKVDKVKFGDDEDSFVKEDSEIVDFSFSKNNKIYLYRCVAAGQNYKEYSKTCEKLVTDNIR